MTTRTFKRWLGWSAVWLAASGALAGQAGSSAAAGGRTHGASGFANATATYEGDIGFADSKTRTGEWNLARGVAVGVDEDGLSLSVSHAIAGQHGPAIATNFNLSIDRDGTVSNSHTLAVGQGPVHRSAAAGGAASHGRGGSSATSQGRADSDRFGRASVQSASQQSGPRLIRASADDRRGGWRERDERRDDRGLVRFRGR